jgi:hypothetical protein
MNLDDDEIELALMMMRYFLNELPPARPIGAVGQCCAHVAPKCKLLIARMEQYQQDRKEGDA